MGIISEREMSLEEWCAKLPGSHRVNRELKALLNTRAEHENAQAADPATIEELLSAANKALDAMCNTVAPNSAFTDTVDELDAAITGAAQPADTAVCMYDNGDGVARCSITKNPIGTDTVSR